MRIKLLLIDDQESDRRIFEALLVRGKNPLLRDIDWTMLGKPFDNLDDYMQFDGVILDEHLGAHRGSEIARQLAARNWLLPVILLTGTAIMLPHTARGGVDLVLDKQIVVRGVDGDTLDQLIRWVIWIARLKTVRGDKP